MRLTNDKRELTVRAAIRSAFDDHMDRAREELAKDIVKELEQAGIPKAEDIPAKFIPYITVCSTYVMKRRGFGKIHTINLPVQFCCKIHNSYTDPLDEAFLQEKESYKRLEALETSRDTAKEQMKQILLSVTTEKQLLELSPELFAFYPSTEQLTHALVPVETVNSVRKILKGVKND